MMQVIRHAPYTMLFLSGETVLASSTDPTDEAYPDEPPNTNIIPLDSFPDSQDSSDSLVSSNMGELDIGDVLAVCTCSGTILRVKVFLSVKLKTSLTYRSDKLQCRVSWLELRCIRVWERGNR